MALWTARFRKERYDHSHLVNKPCGSNALIVQSNDSLREVWGSRPFISAGGYNREHALEIAEKKGDLIAFGRDYIPNVRNAPFVTVRPT